MPFLEWTEEFLGHILAGPTWIVVWLVWLSLINTLSFAFLRYKHSRFVAAMWVFVGPTMILTYAIFGFERILGAVHLFYWGPLLVYLFPKWPRFAGWQPYHVWMRTLLVSNAISLVLDLVDVVRYFSQGPA